MKFQRFLIIIILAPLLFAAKPKFSDNQILAMTPHYFDRNHTSPELLGVNIYKPGKDGFIRLIFKWTETE